jgi:hypothetical protein
MAHVEGSGTTVSVPVDCENFRACWKVGNIEGDVAALIQRNRSVTVQAELQVRRSRRESAADTGGAEPTRLGARAEVNDADRTARTVKENGDGSEFSLFIPDRLRSTFTPGLI